MSQTIAHPLSQMTIDTSIDVELRSVSKVYHGEPVVRNLNLTIRKGEFFSILGPSGCGKTTTLRMIGGFDRPTTGEVWIQGNAVTHLPPNRRPVNTVFQSYALFDHLTVRENIAFGLRLKKLPGGHIEDQVLKALNLVKMEKFASRFPAQLSGGQQQRVALARALVNNPTVVLLDEPLGALDLQLRKEMQLELATLHRELGMTFVMVTHDQQEALSLSDRIAIMKQGVLEQVDSPTQIYESPQTPFVAEFIGDTNLLYGKVEGFHPGTIWVQTSNGLKLQVKVSDADETPRSGPVVVSVRPEKIKMSQIAPTDGVNCFEGRLRNVMYLGTHLCCVVELRSGDRLTVMQPRLGQIPSQDSPVYVWWQLTDGQVLRVIP